MKCLSREKCSITKLDSSGEAKLSNSTLTFTVKVPGTQCTIEIKVHQAICWFEAVHQEEHANSKENILRRGDISRRERNN